MHNSLDRIKKQGFTIVELIIVVVVIGILIAVSLVAYNGLQQRAIDKSVISDADGVSGEVARYGTKNNGQLGGDVTWYSKGASNSHLQFNPSPGNIIDVVADANDYCVRVYNPTSGTYKTLNQAATRESSPGACDRLDPSDGAVTDSGGGLPSTWAELAVGSTHTCGINPAGIGYCWGNGVTGQLGNGTNVDSVTRSPILTSGTLSGKTLKTITAGVDFSCAVASDNRAYCWGMGGNGQLGNGASANSNAPVAVTMTGALSGKTVKDIAAGTNHTCAIASDNNVYCWGYNNYGQLGNNSTTNSTVPVAVTITGALSGKTVQSLSVGQNSTCVIASDNNEYCWGQNSSGQLGNGTLTASLVPTAVSRSGVLSGKTILSIENGSTHDCAIASDNQAYCWGANGSGRVGDGTTVNASSPVAVNTGGVLSGKSLFTIAAGTTSSCAASSSAVYCWGDNGSGQLGNGTNTGSPTPVAVDTSGVLNGKTITGIYMGQSSSSHVCAVLSNATAACWGSNGDGQLGDGTTVSKNSPVFVIR